MVYTMLSIIAIICPSVICILQMRENRHLIDLLATRNPDSVIFENAKPEKRALRTPYKKRDMNEKMNEE